MNAANRLKLIVERVTGMHVFRSLPRGINVFYDIKNVIPDYEIVSIFDVGANIGQSAIAFSTRFPQAQIYCFEPVSASYKELCSAIAAHPNIKAYKTAFANFEGTALALSNGTSTVNRLVTESEANVALDESSIEGVEVLTLDHFCGENNIRKISYLKVDTEGGDLEVLHGAYTMLTEDSIDFVEVEAGVDPNNKYHVPMRSLIDFLEEFGYLVFGFYEQVEERPLRQPQLRRVNITFISSQLASKRSPSD